MQATGSNIPSAPDRTYHFDVDRADELFDILLESKYINLPNPRHKIFSKEEFKEGSTVNGIVHLHTSQITV